MTEMIDISPKVHILHRLRAVKHDWAHLFGEAFDNSLDAGATVINGVLMPDRDAILIQDNGHGITAARLPAVFTAGHHEATAYTKLGRYGIGITEQAINFGDALLVQSVSNEGETSASCDWQEVERSGVWLMPTPERRPAAVDRHGTLIQIGRIRTRFPNQRQLDSLRRKLSERFQPAILDGIDIRLNNQQLDLIPDPKLKSAVSKTIKLSDDRSVKVKAGVLIDQSPLGGHVHLVFQHRVLDKGLYGCRHYTGLKMFFARVQLIGSWQLAPFKDGLTDDAEIEELDAALFAIFEPILMQLEATSYDATIDELSQSLTAMLGDLGARPHKTGDKAESTSSNKSGRPQGVVDPAKSDPANSPARQKAPKNLIKVTFDGISERDGIGVFQEGKPHRVNFSKDHPHIAMLIACKDDLVKKQTFLALTYVLYEAWRDENPQLGFDFDGSFGQRISNRLAAASASDMLGAIL